MPSRVFKMALGCFKPQDSERRASKDVEKKLSLWMKEYNKAIKILLLGAGESGKTTIIKQMKILHIQGFSQSERLEKIRDIRANVLESIVTLVQQMEKFNIPLGSKLNYKPLEFISKIDMNQDFEYTAEFFDNVKKLWDDPGIQECYEKSVEIVPDCAKYFLDRVSEVAQPDFVPTDQDILRSRRTTTDIQKIEFEVKIPRRYGGGAQSFWMFDVGGQRGERRKWIQVFDGIHTILFLVACNTFDQTLSDVEDPNTNRLQEAITLFQDVWSSRFLQDSGFIVFLNKQDLLKKKVESGSVSIGHYFPDYYDYTVDAKDGDNNDVYIRTRCFIRDMLWNAKDTAPPPTPRKFSLGPGFAMIQDESHRARDCYMHFTTATDTNNIQTVFQDVHHMIINQNLELLGLT